MNASSPHSLIIDALKERLDTLNLFKLIDEDHSQINAEFPRLTYPAVLVDIEDCQYEAAGEGSQFVTAELSVKVIQANYSQSSKKAPVSAKERALSVFELEASVVGCLHGWSPVKRQDNKDYDFLSPLVRISSAKTDDDEFGLRIREVRFQTSWEEVMPDGGSIQYPDIVVNGSFIGDSQS